MRRVYSTVLVSVVLAGRSGGTTNTPTPRTHSASASPVADGGPCASVKTTTPIGAVPAACAALWAPYGVTKVPPPNELELEHVPPAAHVVNMTNGAVSDSDAQHWADASNWDSGWYKWAEANTQPILLTHLVAHVNIPAAEEQALTQGASLLQPDCNLYPISYSLFPINDDGHAYFAHKQVAANDPFVLVARYGGGNCNPSVNYPNGQVASLPGLNTSTTVFEPGRLVADSILGELWFTDGGGSCDDTTGPPPEWCGR